MTKTGPEKWAETYGELPKKDGLHKYEKGWSKRKDPAGHDWVYPESDFAGLAPDYVPGEDATPLERLLMEGSSVVEQRAVNSPVEGSSPSPSANLAEAYQIIADQEREIVRLRQDQVEAARALVDVVLMKNDEIDRLQEELDYHKAQRGL